MRAAAALAALLVMAGCGGRPAAPPALELLHARAAHTATALDDGRVLLAGGCVTEGCGSATATTELFDGRRFRPGPRLRTPRDSHTATRLPGGAILLAGGYEREGSLPLASAELVTANGSRPTGAMTTGRGGHVAVSLLQGKGAGGRGGFDADQLRSAVLVAGGSGPDGPLRSAEIYDAGNGVWRAVAPMHHARVAAAAVLLRRGKVLVTGGLGAGGRALASTELFDPATGTWSDGPPMQAARGKHAAVALGDGRVLVLGGAADDEHGSELDSAELYDPYLGPTGWASAGHMAAARYKIPGAVAVRSDGEVVIAGGAPGVELFDPGPDRFTVASRGDGPRLFATATALTDGETLVAGGYDSEIHPSATASLVAR